MLVFLRGQLEHAGIHGSYVRQGLALGPRCPQRLSRSYSIPFVGRCYRKKTSPPYDAHIRYVTHTGAINVDQTRPNRRRAHHPRVPCAGHAQVLGEGERAVRFGREVHAHTPTY